MVGMYEPAVIQAIDPEFPENPDEFVPRPALCPYQTHYGAKRRMTTLASCSHHARISHALQECWPAHYRESSMLQRCSSMCSGTGFERRPRRGCHRWIRDYTRWDSGPI